MQHKGAGAGNHIDGKENKDQEDNGPEMRQDAKFQNKTGNGKLNQNMKQTGTRHDRLPILTN